MIITDHINLFPEHPLRGKNYEEWGPRFPDMSEAYSQRLIAHAKDIAKEKRHPCHAREYMSAHRARHSRHRPNTATSTSSG